MDNIYEKSNPAFVNCGRMPITAEVVRSCPECGSAFQVKKRKDQKGIYCSRKCVGVATGRAGEKRIKPGSLNHDTCNHCGKEFSSYYPNRKYCSRTCFGLQRSIDGVTKMRSFTSKVDKNQKAIVDAFRKVGASVMDTSVIGRGFPDLIVSYGGIIYLVEVKNPENSYGRKGFNKNQQFFSDSWRGRKPDIVRTVDDALRLIGVLKSEPVQRIAIAK